MTDRGVSWVGTISDDLATTSPKQFTRRRLETQQHLFSHRAALFYTPTRNLPAQHVGSGDLDITLPVVTPDYTCLREIRAYGSPRLWVDLLQLQSGKIRWQPISPARIVFVRYDCYTIRHDHVAIGVKGLLDALKVRASGRRDGRSLYYFGAIVDDASSEVDVTWKQVLVEHPKQARVRIQVSSRAYADD